MVGSSRVELASPVYKTGAKNRFAFEPMCRVNRWGVGADSPFFLIAAN